MEDRKQFADLREQRRASRQDTARKAIKRVTYSLIVIALLLLVCACICGLNGGSITIGSFQWTTRGFLMGMGGVIIAAFITNMGGLPIIYKSKSKVTR